MMGISDFFIYIFCCACLLETPTRCEVDDSAGMDESTPMCLLVKDVIYVLSTVSKLTVVRCPVNLQVYFVPRLLLHLVPQDPASAAQSAPWGFFFFFFCFVGNVMKAQMG
ncbi:hypothetical protein LY78DRAFT_397093 [Colletotrichum sublineola]|nr:hypothetical protein LY78DRAFT_397093 [Colletotrichum sublineola]